MSNQKNFEWVEVPEEQPVAEEKTTSVAESSEEEEVKSQPSESETSDSQVGDKDTEDVDEEVSDEEEKERANAVKKIKAVELKMNIFADKLTRLETKFSENFEKKVEEFLKEDQFGDLTLEAAKDIKREVRLCRYNYGLLNEDSLRLLYKLDDIRGDAIVKATRKAQVIRIQASEDHAATVLKHMDQTLSDIDSIINVLEKKEAEKDTVVSQKSETFVDADAGSSSDSSSDDDDDTEVKEDDDEETPVLEDTKSSNEEQTASENESTNSKKDSEEPSKKKQKTELDWAKQNLREVEPQVSQRSHPAYTELLFHLPGVQARDLTLNVEKNKLTVSGFKRPSQTAYENLFNPRVVTGHSRGYWFEKKFELGAGVDADNVTAAVHDNVLTLRLPFTMERRKQVEYAQHPFQRQQHYQRPHTSYGRYPYDGYNQNPFNFW